MPAETYVDNVLQVFVSYQYQHKFNPHRNTAPYSIPVFYLLYSTFYIGSVIHRPSSFISS